MSNGDLNQQVKQRLDHSSGFRTGVVLFIAALFMAVIVLAVVSIQREGKINELAAGYTALQEQNRICNRNPQDPICGQPVAPPVTDIVDEAEVQEGELQNEELQEREIQDQEVQEREEQEAERQQGERQQDESQQAETQDEELQQDEEQEAEEQEAEVQDEEEQEPENQEPEEQEAEVQDEEVDDPDPNSQLNFQVDDQCNPAPGETITDVSASWQRSPGTITLVLSCAVAPAQP